MSTEQRVDLLISGGKLVTMDDHFSVIDDGAIAVSGDCIVAIGKRERICQDYVAAKTVDAAGDLIMPGLINTHTHAAMTLFRGIADDLELGSFLQRVWDVEGEFISKPSVELGAKLGFAEMLLSGITCCADMYWHPFVTAEAAQDLGIRLVSGETFIDFPGADGVDSWPVRMKTGEAFLERFTDHPLVTPVLCPHSVYTVSDAHLLELQQLTDKYQAGIHIHASEAEHEMAQVKKSSGRTPIEVLDRCGLLNKRTWLAHAVHVGESDMSRLEQTKTAVAHCPVSNMKLASGTAPVAQYRERGIVVGLGTDGASTANDLNLWMVMRVAALLQKNANQDASVLAARDVVEMATRGGAQVLSLDDNLGSLEPGKLADMLVISCDQPHAVPGYEPYSHLVYAARPEDVETVIVNGQIVVENKQLKTASTEQLVAETKEFAAAISSYCY